MQFSKYTHAFKLGNDFALYNSLRMKPVYLCKNSFLDICTIVSNGVESIPERIYDEYNELLKYKIIVKDDNADNKILNFIVSKIPEPAVSVCYFILSEQCNLACKYCFLGNNNKDKRSKFFKQNMTKDIAHKGISMFIKQLETQPLDPLMKPNVIFYGGEPLLNFEVLEYVVCQFEALKCYHPILNNIEYSIVTNGLLLTEDRLKRLHELKVSIAISIDGCDENANKMRVDLQGKEVFNRVIQTLSMAKSISIPVSLSITLTEETIKNKQAMLNLIRDYDIKGIGFNILMSELGTKLSPSYNIDAANFIIDMFKDLRELGIYEDRMMRKLKSFVNSQVYFSDCAATSGGQIVIASNGDIGICHGCMAERQYFETDVNDTNFDPKYNKTWREWSRLTPVLKKECHGCEALGICGGGCPINAANEGYENTIHSLDTRFCTHAKLTLQFLISDLYRIVSGKEEICQKIFL